ncbi:MAG: hypothetical protein MAG715_00375 [Methanonatronarchaeales archaeon]|nr:hypothetical protein [Methanonatronarchaeales archaeon]
METKMPVREIMSTNVVSCMGEETVQEVAHGMADNGVGSTIVVSGREAVGILTERDIVRKVVAKNLPVDRVKAEEVMASPLIGIDPDREVNEVARKMRENGVKRFPVVEEGEVIGVVTQTDLLSVAPEVTEILEELAKFRPGAESAEWTSGICDVCGSFVESLQESDGQLVCESCGEGL